VRGFVWGSRRGAPAGVWGPSRRGGAVVTSPFFWHVRDRVWGPDQARYLDFDLDISVGKITRAPTEITRYGRYLGSDPRYLGPGKISRFGP
jgi:hypothetical protein